MLLGCTVTATYSITGIVAPSDATAQVSIDNGAYADVVVNTDGSFSVTGLSNGATYSLKFNAEGYNEKTVADTINGNNVNLNTVSLVSIQSGK
jgi:hypothetical protein